MPTRLTSNEVRQRLVTVFADPALAADNPIRVAPGVGFKIVVYGYFLLNNVGTAQNARFRSAANSKGPLMVFPAAGAVPNVPIQWGPADTPLFECNENEALNLNLSAATAVGIMVQLTVERV